MLKALLVDPIAAKGKRGMAGKRHSFTSRQAICTIRTDQSQIPRAIKKPTMRELEWAAGFLEGEGSFSPEDTTGGSTRVRACQVNPEPLKKLAVLFGGTVRLTTAVPGKRQPIHYWQVCGARARGLAMTLYSLLSEKRKLQIRESLHSTMQ